MFVNPFHMPQHDFQYRVTIEIRTKAKSMHTFTHLILAATLNPVIFEGHPPVGRRKLSTGRSHRAWSVERIGRSWRQCSRGARTGLALRRHPRAGLLGGGAWTTPAGAGLLPASVVFTSALWHHLRGAGNVGGRGPGVVAALDPRLPSETPLGSVVARGGGAGCQAGGFARGRWGVAKKSHSLCDFLADRSFDGRLG